MAMVNRLGQLLRVTALAGPIVRSLASSRPCDLFRSCRWFALPCRCAAQFRSSCFSAAPFKPNTRRPAIVRRHQDITRRPARRRHPAPSGVRRGGPPAEPSLVRLAAMPEKVLQSGRLLVALRGRCGAAARALRARATKHCRRRGGFSEASRDARNAKTVPIRGVGAVGRALLTELRSATGFASRTAVRRSDRAR